MSVIPYLIGAKQFVQEQHIRSLATEVAGASSYGHKAEKSTVNAVGIPFMRKGPEELQNIAYPVTGHWWKDRSQGGIQMTHNPLHAAIQGPGFFQMTDDTFTRDGVFHVNNLGILCSVDGLAFADTGGSPIQIPPKTHLLRIERDGRLLDQHDKTIGQLQVVEFANINQLKSVGHNRYRSEELPLPAVNSSLVQGALEQSNTNIASSLSQAQAVKTDCQVLSSMARLAADLGQKLPHSLLSVEN